MSEGPGLCRSGSFVIRPPGCGNPAHRPIFKGNRRFTRLTNGFSKKPENHSFSLAVYFFHHNFCRIQKGLRVTPAMAANVSDSVMDMSDLVQLIDMMEEPPKPRGPYKKRQPV